MLSVYYVSVFESVGLSLCPSAFSCDSALHQHYSSLPTRQLDCVMSVGCVMFVSLSGLNVHVFVFVFWNCLFVACLSAPLSVFSCLPLFLPVSVLPYLLPLLVSLFWPALASQCF